MIDYMSLFPKEDILTKEIESWKSFGDSMSSKEDRELFRNMLNDCYKMLLLLLRLTLRSGNFQTDAENVCIIKSHVS
jgi:hypothetical protein